MVIGGVHLTARYARYRLVDPQKFISRTLRTHDIGRKGHTKRIAGRLRSTGKWATQAILIAREDYDKGLRLNNVKSIIETFKDIIKEGGPFAFRGKV